MKVNYWELVISEVFVTLIVLAGTAWVYFNSTQMPLRPKSSLKSQSLKSWNSPMPSVASKKPGKSNVIIFEKSPFLSSNCDAYIFEDRAKCCTDPTVPVLAGLDVVKIRHFPGAITWGKPQHRSTVATHHGIYQFYFESATNKFLFDDNPESYLPLFGGFAVDKIDDLKSHKAFSTLGPSCDLRSSMYVDGRLLFFSDTIWDTSTVDPLELKASATKYWKLIFEQKDDVVYNTQCIFVPPQQIHADIKDIQLKLGYV